MNLPRFANDKPMPAAWFQLFNVITVLAFVPIVDRCLYPRLNKTFERAPHLFRMSIGELIFILCNFFEK